MDLVWGRRGFSLRERWRSPHFVAWWWEFAAVCMETGDYRDGEASVDRVLKKKKKENGILQWWRDGERTVGQQRTEKVGGCVWEGLKTLQLYLLVFHLVSQNLRPACWWREIGSQRFSGDSHFCIQVKEKMSCLLSCSFPVLHAFLWCYRSGSSCACRVLSVSNRML